jgi:hypothetical protein
MKYFFFLLLASCSYHSVASFDFSQLQRTKPYDQQKTCSSAVESNHNEKTTEQTTQDKCACCESKKHAGQSFDPKMLSDVENVIRQFENKGSLSNVH